MGGRASWGWRGVALVAAAVDAVAVVTYLAVIEAQGDESVGDSNIVAWAVLMAVPGLLAVVAAVTPPRVAPWVLGLAVLPAGGIGLLAIFTVGLLFLLVALLAGIAALVCATTSARSPVAR